MLELAADKRLDNLSTAQMANKIMYFWHRENACTAQLPHWSFSGLHLSQWTGTDVLCLQPRFSPWWTLSNMSQITHCLIFPSPTSSLVFLFCDWQRRTRAVAPWGDPVGLFPALTFPAVNPLALVEVEVLEAWAAVGSVSGPYWQSQGTPSR